MLSEAGHRQALAREAADATREAERAMLAARRRWDDLRHRLDPHDRRPVNIRVGLAALALVATCLFMLDLQVLSGVMGPAARLPLAMCVTTTWLVAAWCGALAYREGQRRLHSLIAVGTAALSLLLVLVHVFSAAPRQPSRWHHLAAGAIALLLIDSLTAGASALITRIEPSEVAAARASWLRACKSHTIAVRQERQAASAACATTSAWLGLVRTRTAPDEAGAGDDDAEALAQEMLTAALRALGSDDD
jgi:hypothetical protein